MAAHSFKFLQESVRGLTFPGVASTSLKKKHKEDVRMAVSMILIILSFFICWIPLAVQLATAGFSRNKTIFWTQQFSGDDGRYYAHIFWMISFTATILNSIVDPIIYISIMKELRRAIVNVFKCGSKSRIANTTQVMSGMI